MPAWVSTAAQTFLSNSLAVPWEAVDLTPAGLEALRLENSEAATAACVAAQTEVAVTVADADVGGVSVQWVSPRLVRDEATVILYLFGGGFVCGRPEDDLSISARLAEFLGLRVCAPRYRLSPEHPFPAAIDDVKAVYRALTASGTNVVLVGESAGGNLALKLVLDIPAAGGSLPLPVAVALFSPWVDLTHSGDSHAIGEQANRDPTLSVQHFLEPAGMAYAGRRSSTSPDISPLFGVSDFPATLGFPPTFISTATRDLLMSDSVRLATQLRAQGATVHLQVAEGLWHVYEWYHIPEAARSVQNVASFLKQSLQRHTAKVAAKTKLGLAVVAAMITIALISVFKTARHK